MDSLFEDFRTELSGDVTGPCISIYQPTHRIHPERDQDRIRYRNLLDRVRASLREEYPNRDIEKILRPLVELADDRDVWNYALDGLAVFATPEMFRYYRLQRSVPELAVVADSFHLKPILRIIQSADQFQILALDRSSVALFQGNRDEIDEIPVHEDVPESIEEALGDELTEQHLSVARYGGGARGRAMIHGHGSKKEEVDIDTTRFFRAVDRAILKHHSRPSGLPLLLAALPEYHGKFRKISRNEQLMDVALDVHPDSLEHDELRQRAWKAVEPRYLARLQKLTENFELARSRARGSDAIEDIAKAAIAGQIHTMLVDADREIPGRIDPETGVITHHSLEDPRTDDVLDDLSELVLKKGGEVVVVPSGRMPTSSGAAAIYRFSTEPTA